MQRLVSSFVLPLALAVASSLALPARAQLVNRDRSGDKSAEKAGEKGAEKPAAASDDDDILSPAKPDKKGDKGEKAPEAPPPEAAPRAFKVGVVPLIPLGDAGKTLGDEVTAGIIKQLGEGTVFDVAALAVDVKSGAGPALDPAAAKQSVADAAAALEKGRQLLEKLQFGKAKKAFELALDLAEKGAPALADSQPLIDARIGLAEVAARQGQESETETQLAYAASLNPELELDKKKYPPQFIRSFLKKRDQVLKERATIVVDATGAGAAVEIDGRATAGAPVKLTEVPVGKHLVRAVREGLPSWGAIVEVKAGEEITVSPGFVAKDGKSYVDDLQNNRLSPEAAAAVADAAKAAGHKGAVVGVLTKSASSVNVQLVLIDAGTGAMSRLPQVTFQADLLDISIETLKAREAVESTLGAEKLPIGAFNKDPIATLLEGAKAGSAVEMSTIALRYDVKAVKERTGSRIVTGDKKPDDEGGVGSDDEEGRGVLSAGKSGTRQRLDDEDDPYADRKNVTVDPEDPDAPITAQPWFWPTVIGGGAAAVVVVGGATIFTLVATKVLPDPRPANGGQVTIVLP